MFDVSAKARLERRESKGQLQFFLAKDVRIGGGASTIRQYLRAGLIDEMHIAVSPVLLGRGEHLFSGMDLYALGFKSPELIPGEGATHYIIRR